MKWEKVKLGEISEQVRGVSYSKDEVSDKQTSRNLAVLRANNITEEGLLLEDLVFVEKKRISNNQLLKKGDILIAASSGSISVVGRAISIENEIEASFGAFCKVIRPKENVDAKYLGFYFRSADYRQLISHLAAGANINNLRNGDLDNLEIPLPPLPIQKRIAEILDKADALRRKDQLLLQKYDQLAQAIFIDMFGDPVKNEKGWEVKKANQLVKVIGGAAFKSEDYSDEGIPLIRIGTVNKGFFDRAQLAFLPISFLISYKRYIVKSGDLLITLTGTVGKDDYGNVFTLSDEYDNYLLNQRVAKLDMFSKELKTDYFKYYLKQKEVKAELTGVSRGVRQANISNYDIYELDVPIPPTNLQEIFVKALAPIWDAKNKLAENESTSLFQTLLQKAFKGELTTTTEYA